MMTELGRSLSSQIIRQKRLPKYYLNGNDAFRLKLWIPEPKVLLPVS